METAKYRWAGDAFNSLAHLSLPLRGRIVSYSSSSGHCRTTDCCQERKSRKTRRDDLNLLTQIGWLGDKTELRNEIMLFPTRMDRARITKSC